MLMHPAPSSETSNVPSLRVRMSLSLRLLVSSGLFAHAANTRGAAASPAPMRAVRAIRSRRLIPRTSLFSVTSDVSLVDRRCLVGLHPTQPETPRRGQWLVIHVLATHPNRR